MNSPLDVVDRAFCLLAADPNSAVPGSELHPELPATRLRLDELKRHLLAGSLSFAARDAVLAGLIDRARRDGPVWSLAVCGLVLPALRMVSIRLSRSFAGDRDELDAEIVCGAMRAITTMDLERPKVAARIQLAAWCAAKALVFADAPPPVGTGEGFESAVPPAPWGHPDLVLARAVRRRVLSPEQAELIGRTRLEHVPLAEAAVELGIAYGAARQRRSRAERRLVHALRTGVLDGTASCSTSGSSSCRVWPSGRSRAVPRGGVSHRRSGPPIRSGGTGPPRNSGDRSRRGAQ